MIWVDIEYQLNSPPQISVFVFSSSSSFLLSSIPKLFLQLQLWRQDLQADRRRERLQRSLTQRSFLFLLLLLFLFSFFSPLGSSNKEIKRHWEITKTSEI